ncbi:MAG: hypothetical protein K6G60_00325 [Lachnospiraceae bacterium]|nr:hypothetical protein [Lachnospiraceae bacterium]
MKKLLLQLPKVNVSSIATKDYACGTYTDSNGNVQYDFSCNPYGNQGKIDADDRGLLQKIIDFIFGREG